MNRRELMGGAVAALLLSRVERAFAVGPSARQIELFATWHHARKAGKPLLVVVIPDDGQYERGRAVGGALSEASDALYAALSQFEPACATIADLHLLGVVVPVETWFVVVRTDAVPAGVRPIPGPPPRDRRDPIDGALDVLETALLSTPLPPEIRALAGVGEEAWVRTRLPGSHWAHEGGCGRYVEEVEQQFIIGCGMGSVPERAARFLTFYDFGDDGL